MANRFYDRRWRAGRKYDQKGVNTAIVGGQEWKTWGQEPAWLVSETGEKKGRKSIEKFDMTRGERSLAGEEQAEYLQYRPSFIMASHMHKGWKEGDRKWRIKGTGERGRSLL